MKEYKAELINTTEVGKGIRELNFLSRYHGWTTKLTIEDNIIIMERNVKVSSVLKTSYYKILSRLKRFF